jgi:hypothetical protein
MSCHILSKKLVRYGFNEHSIKVVEGFLMKRQQIVEIDGVYSEAYTIDKGVPQGSLSGPRFFNIFINDLPVVCDRGDIGLFADDTSSLNIGTNLKETIDDTNVSITQMVKWLDENCMEVNDDKSVVINFTTPRSEILVTKGQIMCRGVALEVVKEAKFLGVWLDCKLSGDIHIKKLMRKLVPGVAAILKTRHHLDLKYLKLIYHSLFTSNLVYGAEFFGLNYKNKIYPLSIIQKRALRIMLGLGFRDSLGDYWKTLRILPVPLLMDYIICMFIYRSINGYYLNVLELKGCKLNTRGKTNSKIILEHASSDQARFSMLNLGATIWNGLPDYLTVRKGSVISFKRNLKRYLLEGLSDEKI